MMVEFVARNVRSVIVLSASGDKFAFSGGKRLDRLVVVGPTSVDKAVCVCTCMGDCDMLMHNVTMHVLPAIDSSQSSRAV